MNKASFNFGVRNAARIIEGPHRIHGQGEVSVTISSSLYVLRSGRQIAQIIDTGKQYE